MAVTSQSIEGRVRALAEDAVTRAGYDLVDVEYRREPAGWILRLYIDRQGGVSLADCERVSHEFGTVLEVEDVIPHHFNLEISSPGLDRPLRKEGDFLAAQGRLVRLVTRRPISGQRNFTGRLLWAGLEDGVFGLRLRDDTGAEHSVPVELIDKARLIHEWPAKPAKGPARQGHRSGRK